MKRLRRSVLDGYVRTLDGIKAASRQALAAGLEAIDFDSPTAYGEVLELMRTVGMGSNELAASVSAGFYDSLRAEEIGEELGATLFSAYDETSTARAAGATVKAAREKGLNSAVGVAYSRVGFDIAKSAGDTIFSNGRKDRRRVRYARVPSGIETCDFCLMLASRGFVYANAGTAGENAHYHANCRCSIVPSFGPGLEVEGYDTDAIFKGWQEIVSEKAKAAAERNGSTVKQERDEIMRGYEKSAKRSKDQAKKR